MSLLFLFLKKRAAFIPLNWPRLDRSRVPKHIAIIPDGNRRWAKKRLSDIRDGHREGADTLMEIVKSAKELGIEAITFYSFSTENWNRPPDEVMSLMALFTTYLIGAAGGNGPMWNTFGYYRRFKPSPWLFAPNNSRNQSGNGCMQQNHTDFSA